MKTFLKVLAGLAVVVVLALVAVFYFTAGMSEAAEAFFRAVQAKDTATAKTYLSEGFRAETSDAELQQFLDANALTSFADATWSRREVSGGTGELEGTITTANGGTIPLKLVFVKEAGAWKLHGITKTAGGVQSDARDADDDGELDDATETRGAADAAAPEVPSAEEQAALLKRTLADFAVSIGAGNMKHFRGASASVWQEQFPLEKFEESFGSVYQAGFDFQAASELDPVIEQPATALGEHGDLVINGYFPSDPRLVVEAKYVSEGGTWKPYGFQVDTQ